MTILPSGAALPNRRLTPGAVLAGVTRAQVCTPGWADEHRDVTEEARRAVFAEYGISYAKQDRYEVDHLVPLELGGSNAKANLWPEPEGGNHPGYLSKDRLENHLHALVCSGRLALATAQHAIAVNWWKAYRTYMKIPVPAEPTPTTSQTQTPTPTPTQTPTPTPSSSLPVVHPGAFCSVAGARGVTTAGTPMICKTTPTDDRLRWRHA